MLARGLAVLRRRSEKLVPITAALRARADAGELSVPVTELASSYLHMHANRMLRSGQRAQEMVLYDLLCRIYATQAARGRGKDRVSFAEPAPALA